MIYFKQGISNVMLIELLSKYPKDHVVTIERDGRDGTIGIFFSPEQPRRSARVSKPLSPEVKKLVDMALKAFDKPS